eukprot:640549-Lingulodinium_polyedra.AAC.1
MAGCATPTVPSWRDLEGRDAAVWERVRRLHAANVPVDVTSGLGAIEELLDCMASSSEPAVSPTRPYARGE